MNGMQHMHISCRLLHTTLHVQPPKLILTGRFVKKNLPGLIDKTRKHMYTLHKLTSNDTIKVSIILPDGQTATLVCHRRRPPPPTPTHKASAVYPVVLKWKHGRYTQDQCWAGISGGSCHFNYRQIKRQPIPESWATHFISNWTSIVSSWCYY